MLKHMRNFLAAALVIAAPVVGRAAISPYSQNFETLVKTSATALSADGWVVFGNVFSPDHSTYLYGYGTFPAPNGGNGFCAIGPDEWLAHPGSVGRALLGTIHILDEDGGQQTAGEPGQIWFESPVRFEYHNDPDKTAQAFNDRGWSSLGDVGYLDDEGYLYLTDRISHMIISGGVNIYPQEIENLLTMHPAVADVAVIGVPNADFGEEVKAVVSAADPAAAGEQLAGELIAFCKERMATYKCPASVDFVDDLPRLPTGKLLKRELRARYLA